MTTTAEPARTAAAHARECRAAARREGVVPALRLLNAALAPGGPPRGATGHALVPDDTAPLPGAEATAPGLALSGPAPGAGPSDAWRLALAWLRLGASERLRDQAVARLGERRTEGGPLLMKQLVKGALADVLTEHLEAECVLGEAGEEAGAGWLGHIHERITRADRALLRLLGAYGFVVPGPGWDAHLSELLADVYRAPGTVTSEEA
jgi:hypothetical protein